MDRPYLYNNKLIFAVEVKNFLLKYPLCRGMHLV